MTQTPTESDVRARLARLVREHGEIKERVAGYQRRRWLSAGEELELKTLQRLKLRKKDEIVVAERALVQIETRFDVE